MGSINDRCIINCKNIELLVDDRIKDEDIIANKVNTNFKVDYNYTGFNEKKVNIFYNRFFNL
jgi:hypothetical protein